VVLGSQQYDDSAIHTLCRFLFPRQVEFLASLLLKRRIFTLFFATRRKSSPTPSPCRFPSFHPSILSSVLFIESTLAPQESPHQVLISLSLSFRRFDCSQPIVIPPRLFSSFVCSFPAVPSARISTYSVFHVVLCQCLAVPRFLDFSISQNQLSSRSTILASILFRLTSLCASSSVFHYAFDRPGCIMPSIVLGPPPSSATWFPLLSTPDPYRYPHGAPSCPLYLVSIHSITCHFTISIPPFVYLRILCQCMQLNSGNLPFYM